jgi:HlyD family secretion protein
MARSAVPAMRGGTQIAVFDDVPATPPSVKEMGFSGSLVIGAILIAVFIGGFGAWAALAPLQSAAIAHGEVIVEGYRRTVDHLEGGIVKEILVTDGRRVETGTPLIRLDDTQAKANMQLLQKRWQDNSALAARLKAEQSEAAAIAFPPWLLEEAKTDENAASVIETQQTIFQSRADTIASQISMLDRRTAQFQEEIIGLHAEIDAIDQEMVHIRAELGDVNALVEQGLARRERLYSLQRQMAVTLGRRGRNIADIARANQSISENKLRIEAIKTEARETAIRELRDVQVELADISERMLAARDVLQRTTITAPTAGIVLNSTVHTSGAVVRPGEPLMEIVPNNEQLVIQARLDPIDIDVVKAQLPARVRLTALSARTTPELEAWVERVSADRLVDEKTGAVYYEARVRLLQDEVKRLDGKELFPGMPVEVMIATGDTTLLEYLVQPITDLMRRGFTES